ncbi:MAG: hypothetical protein ABJH63_10505 [Rhizobiaceae bacterium]
MSIAQCNTITSQPSAGLKSWIIRQLSSFRAWRHRRRQQRIDRLAFQQMLYLDDHLLNDVGYQRFELEDANSLPLDTNAAQAVQMVRTEHRTGNGIKRPY